MVVRTTSLKSLKSLKSLFPNIHQPQPLDRRESQKLLESITTSFRKNLDKEHPLGRNDRWHPQNSTAQNRPTPLSVSTSSSLLPDTSSRHRPTDRLIRAILSNPLFTHNSKKPPTADTDPDPDPFDVFNRAVSRGLMTPQGAAGFLVKVQSQIDGESADEVRQRMASSGAGLLVLQWLRASGRESNLSFLSVPSLHRALVPFMYAEGLEEVAWAWVARLLATKAASETASPFWPWQVKALESLLGAIIKGAGTPRSWLKTSLDGSYETMMRVNDTLPMQNRFAREIFEIAWANLSWVSTVGALHRPKPSASLFESFVDIGRPLKMWLDMAHLDLYHPLTPDHFAALQFMHHNVPSDQMSRNTRRRLVYLALDTTDRLKQVGDVDEASWVERFVAWLGSDLNLGIFNTTERNLIASELPIRHMW
ncbi:hypothetical protein F4677DRAFT_215724 [Hypoxylon crocopeplum]|nr:hypothetical protein F4677DRAFT_215724 [Hypoxylon crocopeplum]